MKKKAPVFFICLVLVFGITTRVLAAGNLEVISAYLNHDIKIVYNGETQSMTDAAGKAIYPISYNGTTYLPVRAISGMLGVGVAWDGANQILYMETQAPASGPSIKNDKIITANFKNGTVAANNAVLAIKNDGTLWGWGDNAFGILGKGTTKNSNSPVKIMDNVASVSIGDYHAVAVKNDGSLWTWGSNMFGMLGNGITGRDELTPIKLMEDVTSACAGSMHSAAVKKDGSLWIWGEIVVGDGTFNKSNVPVKVMDSVSSVSSGTAFIMALKTDGSLWAWGNNEDGRLGDGTSLNSYVPVKIMESVAMVDSGSLCSLAVKTDGSLWTWGPNQGAQIGNGTRAVCKTPVKVLEEVAYASMGSWHAAAIKKDNTLWTWGNNEYGELMRNGDSTVPGKAMDGVASAAVGHSATYVTKADGSLWGCGSNYGGILGIGSDAESAVLSKITDNVELPSANAPTGLTAAHSDGVLKEILTSKYQNEYLKISVEGPQLTVSGKISDKKTKSIRLLLNEIPIDHKNITQGVDFSGRYNLSLLPADDISVGVFKYSDNSISLWGLGFTKLIKENGIWHFKAEPSVFERNKTKMSGSVDIEKAISEDISAVIKAQSEKIAGSTQDKYKKLLLIHDWVAENIYYDRDYFFGESDNTYTAPEDVLKNKRTVCEGYANLTKALLNAQGIPCIVTTGYALGLGTTGEWTEAIINDQPDAASAHAWNEVYVDGRWVILDVTWDSQNIYSDGRLIKEDYIDHDYFDSDLSFFSLSHKIVNRGAQETAKP